MRILHASDPRFGRHDTGPGHPERPARLEAVAKGVDVAALGEDLVPFTPEPAPVEAIARVHPGAYLDRLEALTAAGGGHIDADTTASAGSWEALLLAAGAGLGAVEQLRAGAADAAFLAVRPPGHHATPTRPMGFCLVNNVAVTAAALAAAGERVLVVDVDAHHGNGTQDAFVADPRVLFVSFHEWPLYPGTGALDDIGRGDGLGYTVNFPLPAGATGDVYRAALDEVVRPMAASFAPDWLLVSAGFDAHVRDPLTGLALTSADFASIAAELVDLVEPGRTVLFLEGGYDLPALEASVAAVLARLTQRRVVFEEESAHGPGHQVIEAVRLARAAHDLDLACPPPPAA